MFVLNKPNTKLGTLHSLLEPKPIAAAFLSRKGSAPPVTLVKLFKRPFDCGRSAIKSDYRLWISHPSHCASPALRLQYTSKSQQYCCSQVYLVWGMGSNFAHPISVPNFEHFWIDPVRTPIFQWRHQWFFSAKCAAQGMQYDSVCYFPIPSYYAEQISRIYAIFDFRHSRLEKYILSKLEKCF